MKRGFSEEVKETVRHRRSYRVVCCVLGVWLLFRLFGWKEEYRQTENWQSTALFHTAYLIHLYEEVEGRLPEKTDEALAWWKTQFGSTRDPRVDPQMLDVIGMHPAWRSIPTLVKSGEDHWYLTIPGFEKGMADDGNWYTLAEIGTRF